MSWIGYLGILLSIVWIDGSSIPFIRNVTLIPRYQWNSTTITNSTIHQCLCLSASSFVAFNWYPNNTCQLFYTFPITYKIQSMSNARIYFPQRIFPNVSQCCMPDLAFLLNKLSNGTRTYVNITDPRNLLIDAHGYLVTVEMQPPKLVRFDARTLAVVNRTTLPNSYAMTVTFANNAYFVGIINGPILVMNSGNLTILNQISSPQIQDIRSIIFLENGRTMVTNNGNNRTINFFRRNNNSSFNYTYAYQQLVSYPSPHGLTAYNDSLFYVTSYMNNTIYSYTIATNSGIWDEQRIVNAQPIRNISGGTFMTIDECGRYWFSLETSAVYIFDHLGSLAGIFSFGIAMIMDTLIADDYVMYFTDRRTNASRIIRIDPNIDC